MHHIYWSPKRAAVLGTAIALLFCATPVMAATKTNTTKSSSSSDSSNVTSGVTQSYSADGSVQTGMIVKLKTKDPSSVVPLDSSDIKNLLGIVVPANGATIVLTPKTVTQQQVLVATAGHYGVLVSNQNGAINIGDYVTVSAIAGVGMRAGEDQEEILGKAASAFTGAANVIGSVKLKDATGKDTAVSIGRVAIDINVAHNPLFSKTPDYVPGFLSKVAVAVANKPVTAGRIYLSMALLLATSLVTGNMLYSGVRSGMSAIGRNPLSKKSIIRSLIQTVMAGLIIFIAGVFAVYLLLKL